MSAEAVDFSEWLRKHSATPLTSVAYDDTCETCGDDCRTAPWLDRHDAVEWKQDGGYRTGRVVYDSALEDAYWVIPDVLESDHEVECKIVWAGLSGFVWLETVYDDHTRRENESYDE